ncbi:MAG TPA: hypothetical protein VG222_08215, partial [Vicinamibacterales bacterium]|nr:hypothetical protein [Vicinamibacterales bacterium]
MKFIACSQPSHKDWGVNSPVNLDLCLSYTPGKEVPHSRSERGAAPAIMFVTISGNVASTWTFESVADRDAEIARIEHGIRREGERTVSPPGPFTGKARRWP